MVRETETILAELAINIPSAKTRVSQLSGGQRQTVAIARAVHRGGQLMIMDEPTAALGVQEGQKALTLIRELQRRGLAILVVSHNLEDGTAGWQARDESRRPTATKSFA